MVGAFVDLFCPPSGEKGVYGAQPVVPPQGAGTCSMCQHRVDEPWWFHVLYECRELAAA